jgi:hypothetical protein
MQKIRYRNTIYVLPSEWLGVPVHFDAALSNEATQHHDTIFVGPKFLALWTEAQTWILTHEVGHWVSSVVGLGHWAKLAKDMGIDVWSDLPWGQPNMEEAFAESFTVAVEGDDTRWPEWQELALLVAEQVVAW